MQSKTGRFWTVAATSAAMLALAALALAAFGSPVAGAAGKGHRTLPAGFPYAAEIQATIRYDGTYTRDTAGTVACGTSADGSTVTAPVHTHEITHFDRTLSFSHITVPVATPDELGAAAARLGLEPTVTTPGRIKADHSSMELEYTSTEGENEGCHATPPATCYWSLLPVPASATQEIFSHHNGTVPTDWTISVLGDNSTTGDCAVNDGTDQLSAMLEDAGRLYPPALEEGFPDVTISRGSGLGGDFHRLQKDPEVKFELNVSVPAGTTHNCSTSLNPEAGTCTDAVVGRAEVELRRLFLYKSKHPYPR